MSDFRIVFSQPWLLLLLIPAIAITLIPHFRLSKRYRRTRNRITSIVLHLVVMFLATVTLAGMTFNFNMPNTENEIILLVDVSHSEEKAQASRDNFVKTVLSESKYDNYKVGVVTFGFDQRYAVPLTYETEGIYNAYIQSVKAGETANLSLTPDQTATNLADALSYTMNLFDNPQSAKIVLVTDGKETDKSANDVIRNVAASGIKVDVAYVPSDYTDDTVQLVGIELPEYYVGAGEDFPVTVILQAKKSTKVTVSLLDNGDVSEVAPPKEETVQGLHRISFTHKLGDFGFHAISAQVALEGDGLTVNNEYTTYINLEKFNNILIIERADESTALMEMLNDKDEYVITVQRLGASEAFTSVDELRVYDQVILNNISYDDIKQAYAAQERKLDELLEEYVKVYGGGVFTVGGNNGDKANAYNRTDLFGTTYQKMLPVQAINYTPPIGVMFILDKSGSMTSSDKWGASYLELAKSAIANCLRANSETSEVAVFDDRDYVGLMTLDTVPEVILRPTACTEKDEVILKKLKDINSANGNTMFTPAIQRAGELLRTEKRVDKRHIVIVTDGGALDQGKPYVDTAQKFYESDGITCSVLAIGMTESDPNYDKMKELTDAAGGNTILANVQNITQTLRNELTAPEISEVNIPEGGFAPIVNKPTSPLVRDFETHDNKMSAKLKGFYGVKARESSEVILVGDYEVPIYAQWKYGKGMVGSFMSDLNGTWSSDFMSNADGSLFIKRVVNNLMPIENIRPSEITVLFKEDNYTNTLEIDAGLKDGERVTGAIYAMDNPTVALASLNELTPDTEDTPLSEKAVYVTSPLSEITEYTQVGFVVKRAGVYKIVLTKYNGETEVESVTLYKSFSYSEEYDWAQVDEEVTGTEKAQMEKLASRGEGVFICDENLANPVQVFEGFITKIPQSYDPRTVFMIMAICAFLLDIAVRKFKFKWIHEIIREHKEKKNFK